MVWTVVSLLVLLFAFSFAPRAFAAKAPLLTVDSSRAEGVVSKYTFTEVKGGAG